MIQDAGRLERPGRLSDSRQHSPFPSTLAIRIRHQPVYPAEPPFRIGRVVAERVAVPQVKRHTLAIRSRTACGLQGVFDSLGLPNPRHRLPGKAEFKAHRAVGAKKRTLSCRPSPNCHHNRVHGHPEFTSVVYSVLRSINYWFPPWLGSRSAPREDSDRVMSEPGKAREFQLLTKPSRQDRHVSMSRSSDVNSEAGTQATSLPRGLGVAISRKP